MQEITSKCPIKSTEIKRSGKKIQIVGMQSTGTSEVVLVKSDLLQKNAEALLHLTEVPRFGGHYYEVRPPM